MNHTSKRSSRDTLRPPASNPVLNRVTDVGTTGLLNAKGAVQDLGVFKLEDISPKTAKPSKELPHASSGGLGANGRSAEGGGAEGSSSGSDQSDKGGVKRPKTPPPHSEQEWRRRISDQWRSLTAPGGEAGG